MLWKMVTQNRRRPNMDDHYQEDCHATEDIGVQLQIRGGGSAAVILAATLPVVY
jgi:hypothetical protein